MRKSNDTKDLEEYLEAHADELEIDEDENEDLIKRARKDVEARKARAARLQKLRKEKLKVSQSQLAKAVGANFRTLQSWEQGRQDFPQAVEILMTMMNKYANVRKELLGFNSLRKSHPSTHIKKSRSHSTSSRLLQASKKSAF